METVDDETSAAAIDFIRRQHAAGTPFFVWWNGCPSSKLVLP